ncbi:MAG: hypothetical protein AAGM46_28205, partial [Cyanobacteria bacterium J06582_2]
MNTLNFDCFLHFFTSVHTSGSDSKNFKTHNVALIFTKHVATRFKMGKKKDIDLKQKDKIMLLTKLGLSYRKIANILRCSPSTCCRVWKQSVTTGIQKPRAQFRKQRKYKERDLRHIRRAAVQRPFATAREIQQDVKCHGIQYSKSQINKILKQHYNLHARRPAKKPILTKSMKKKRLQFAQKFRSFS